MTIFYITIPLGPSLTQIAYGPGSLGDLVGNTVGFAITLGAVFALLWLIWGAIAWITGGGDKAQVEAARDRITQALIGFAIVMASWAIWFLVTNRFFGLNLTSGGSFGSGSISSTSGSGSSSGRSGCQIVQTDQGPGCWCASGDWQFHCAAGAKRGDPASSTCIADCAKRNS